MNRPIPDADLEAELRRLRPRGPADDLRDRLAVALAGPAPAGNRRAAWLAERLAWAAAGAVAAALALTVLPSGGPRPGTLDAAASGALAQGTGAAPAEVSEAAVAWADDGVKFLDDRTPARVLRRLVVERHRAADGPELRVPREDVIVLPVAFQ